MKTRVLTVLHALLAALVLAGSAVAGLRASEAEGLVCLVPALVLLPWFVFSVGLCFLRRWAWWGSFGSVIGLYCILGYFALMPVPGGPHSDPSGLLNAAGVVVMSPFAAVVILLLLVRRKVFGGVA
ncbi:MAG: hypothetical protein NT154_03000 [Verrucomicrobia bacterium]|nr:hypothetical protein [Verrucomicrobiota bacterium]